MLRAHLKQLLEVFICHVLICDHLKLKDLGPKSG